MTADGKNAFFDASGSVKSYEEISGVLAKSLTGLTKQQQLAKLETIFGSDAIRAAAVAAKLGAGEYGNLGDEIRKVDAGSVAARRMDSLKASVNQFKGSAETTALVLMGKLTPGFRTVIDTGTQLLNTVLERLDTPGAAVFFDSLAQAVVGASDTLNDMAGALGSWADEFEGAEDTLGRVANRGLTALSYAVQGVSALLQGDAKVAADMFTQSFDALGEAVVAVKDGAIATLTSALDTVGETLSRVMNTASNLGLWDDLGNAWNTLKDAVGTAGERLGSTRQALEDLGIVGGRAADWPKVLGLELKILGLNAELAAIGLSGLIDGVLTSITVLANSVAAIGHLKDAIGALARGDLPAAGQAFDRWKEAAGRAKDAALDWADNSKERVTDAANVMQQIVQTSGQAIEAATARDFGRSALNVGNGAAEMQRFMEENVGPMGSSAEAAMGAVVAATESGMSDAAGAVESQAPAMAQTLAAAGYDMAAATADSMQSVASETAAGMADAVAAVESAGPDAVAAVDSMGEGMIDSLDATAPALAFTAEYAAAGAVSAVSAQQAPAEVAGSSVGDSIGSGLQSGILSWVTAIYNAGARLVSAAIEGATGPQGADAHSPSRKMQRLAKDVKAGFDEEMASWAPGLAAKIRDFIDAAHDYAPVAGEIARVEREIKDIRERSQTDALFRANDMVDVESELLRLKKDQAVAERNLLPTRQALADASREIADIERGSLPDQEALIEIDAERKQIRLAEIELERTLIGLKEGSKEARNIQKELDQLRDRDRLLGLDRDKLIITNELAATGARVRKAGLDDAVRGAEANMRAVENQIAVLDAEGAIFRANEAIIKDATDNEIAYREQLIAVFESEAAPLTDRIEAGLELVEQLEKEGTISKELANHIRQMSTDARNAGTPVRSLASAVKTAGQEAQNATPDQKALAAAMAAQKTAATDASTSAGLLTTALRGLSGINPTITIDRTNLDAAATKAAELAQTLSTSLNKPVNLAFTANVPNAVTVTGITTTDLKSTTSTLGGIGNVAAQAVTATQATLNGVGTIAPQVLQSAQSTLNGVGAIAAQAVTGTNTSLFNVGNMVPSSITVPTATTFSGALFNGQYTFNPTTVNVPRDTDFPDANLLGLGSLTPENLNVPSGTDFPNTDFTGTAEFKQDVAVADDINVNDDIIEIDSDATGGAVYAGRTVLVGERGPELFVPPEDGWIVPNNRIGDMAGGYMMDPSIAAYSGETYAPAPGGGGTTVVNNHFHINGNTILGQDRSVAQQLARIIAPELSRRVGVG